MNQNKVILLFMLSLILFTGCRTKEPIAKEPIVKEPITSEKTSISSNAVNISKVNEKEEKININLYLYGADDYENPYEIKAISVSKKLYENNMTEALNLVFEETEISFKSVELDKETNCLTVDLTQEVVKKFNSGSSNGITLTNELINTILNLPDIKSAVITVDGEKDSYADHYSFEGVFTLLE